MVQGMNIPGLDPKGGAAGADQEACEAPASMLQFVTFVLAGEHYAVEILKVREVNTMREITPVPKAPAFLAGAMNLRGKVVPVLDLRRRFGLDSREPDERTKIIIMIIRGVVMGVIVDAVLEVLRVLPEQIVPPLPASARMSGDFIRGIIRTGDTLVIAIDADRLFSEAEQGALFGMAGSGT